MVLVVLMHFILGKKEDKMKSLGDNTIEYNFISLYSNLLFYFSLSAHHIHVYHCACNDIESALLINCVFISFIVIIHKEVQAESRFSKLLATTFDWLWLAVLFLIFILIISVNFHLHGFELTTDCFYVKELGGELIVFLLVPSHFLLAFFMYMVIHVTIRAWKNQYQKSILNYQKSSPEQENESQEINKNDRINSLLKIAENLQSKAEVRAQSFYYVAEFYFKKNDFNNATKYILESKNIAVNKPYPEIQLLPIRKLKIEIHIKLGEKDKARLELREVEIQLESAHANLKKTISFCITQLKNLIEPHA